MIQRAQTITEVKKNKVYKIESDYEIFIVTIPDEFEKMTPNQLWLLMHQITAFAHGLGFDHGYVIENEELEGYKYRGDRKFKHQKVKPEYKKQELMSLLTWYADYKTNWTNGKEYDCHPQNWEAFMESEKRGDWEERLYILLMIVLLQNINGKNVKYTRKPDKKLKEAAA